MLSGHRLLTALAAFALLSGCAPRPEAAAAPGSTPEAGTASSILAWSRPAVGSTVSAPVNELVLHFTPPARLGEVTVTGPDGAMPMMVTAVGEVEHYSLPLTADTPGAYTVAWRATRQGREHQGSFGFTIR
ncbi:MAG: copper resistance protein CopC [Pseudomonadota bacterium]|nr:copper resistance protein CopC [Pseudomonadota bacterium]